MLLNGEKTTSVPEKGDYNVEVTCDNGAIGSWDYEEWGPNIRNLNSDSSWERIEDSVGLVANAK